MRGAGVRALLAFGFVALSGGCGTMMGNLGGSGDSGGHYLEPYGGVKICLEAGTEKLCAEGQASAQGKVPGWLAGAYLLGVDMPLSAVADTVTLPVTLVALYKGEARTGPVNWGGVKREPLPNPDRPPPDEGPPEIGPVEAAELSKIGRYSPDGY
jgi:uncharacterized protein YceK